MTKGTCATVRAWSFSPVWPSSTIKTISQIAPAIGISQIKNHQLRRSVSWSRRTVTARYGMSMARLKHPESRPIFSSKLNVPNVMSKTIASTMKIE